MDPHKWELTPIGITCFDQGILNTDGQSQNIMEMGLSMVVIISLGERGIYKWLQQFNCDFDLI